MAAQSARLTVVLVLILLGFCESPRADGALITSFETAFQPTAPAPGWSYLWNNAGPIGNPANYTPLLPTPGGRYRSDGTENSPSPPPAAFLAFQRFDEQTVGGHPGMGELQAGSGGIERYAIAAFTLASTEAIAITNGVLRNINPNSGGSTDGLNLRVFVNDNPLPAISAATSAGFGSQATFEGALGPLNAGDKIYVAIGSKDSDQFDGFALEYDIVSVPEPHDPSLGIIGVGLAMIFARPRSQRCKGARL